MLIIFAGTNGYARRSAGGAVSADSKRSCTGSSRTRTRGMLHDDPREERSRRRSSKARSEQRCCTEFKDSVSRQRHAAAEAKPMPSLIDIRRRIRSRQEHAADHQGHEDGLGGEAAPGAGTRVAARPYAAMLRADAGERGRRGRERTRKRRVIRCWPARPEKRIQLILFTSRHAAWPGRSTPT